MMNLRHDLFDADGAADEIGAAWRGDRLFDDFGASLADLRDSVGKFSTNHRDDVAKVESLLATAGDLDLTHEGGPTGWGMFSVEGAVADFQERKGLKRDGRIFPEGPTIAALAKTTGARPPPNSDARLEAEARGASPTPAAPAPGTLPTGGADADDNLFNYFRHNLREQEGGFSIGKDDPGGPTMKGVSKRFLDEYNRRHPEYGLPSDPAKLTGAQITGLFRREFHDQPKIPKLARVPGLDMAAPRLAEQIFDAGVLHGPAQAGKWLQEALEEELEIDIKTKGANGKTYHDGIIGPQTRSAIARAVNQGKIGAVNDAIVEKRLEFMRGLPNYQTHRDGWTTRANSFRQSIPRF